MTGWDTKHETPLFFPAAEQLRNPARPSLRDGQSITDRLTGGVPDAEPRPLAQPLPLICVFNIAAAGRPQPTIFCRKPAAQTANQQDKMTSHECIQICQKCLAACEHCASSCLREEHVEEMSRCIALDRSCADVCALTARELLRASPFANDLCTLCAGVCESCADECGQHDADHCQNCASACRDCAMACRLVVGAVPAAH